MLGVVENMSGLQQRLSAVRFVLPQPVTAAAPAAANGMDAATPQTIPPADVTDRVRALLARELGAESSEQLLLCSDVFEGAAGVDGSGTRSGAQRMCDEMGVAMLGVVPLDPALGKAAEAGQSVFSKGCDGSPLAQVPVSLASLNAIVAKIRAATDAADVAMHASY